MGTEIERKFLVKGTQWHDDAISDANIRQGFVSTDPERIVRLRLTNGRALLTIKGRATGVRRSEYEYEIPLTDAEEMLEDVCHHGLIEKTRYRVPHAGNTWEVDVFYGDNAGLLLAEIELRDESDAISLPAWVGPEVTDDRRYFNAYLAEHPYSEWSQSAYPDYSRSG